MYPEASAVELCRSSPAKRPRHPDESRKKARGEGLRIAATLCSRQGIAPMLCSQPLNTSGQQLMPAKGAASASQKTTQFRWSKGVEAASSF